jgi:hypothetical protein
MHLLTRPARFILFHFNLKSRKSATIGQRTKRTKAHEGAQGKRATKRDKQKAEKQSQLRREDFF